VHSRWPCASSRDLDPGQSLRLNHGSIAKCLTHLAHDATAKAKAKTILSKADQAADEFGMDDELLDGLVVRLGLE